MRCIKRATLEFNGDDLEAVKNRATKFREFWSFVYTHYTQENCSSGCPCMQFSEENDVDIVTPTDVSELDAVMALLESDLQFEDGMIM